VSKSMKIIRTTLAAAAGIACVLAAPALAFEQSEPDLTCKMRYTMKGWSAIYKEAKGTGVVSCSDGSRLPVRLSMHGGGITVGKSTVDDGVGKFTGVKDIQDVIGSYAAGEAHAGAVKSADATVVGKGDVTLGLAGNGRGWDLGLDFANLTITPRHPAQARS
jgi:hypothetical protein